MTASVIGRPALASGDGASAAAAAGAAGNPIPPGISFRGAAVSRLQTA